MFLTHESVLTANSFLVLPQFNNRRILAKTDTEYRLMTNVCPHQRSIISIESGTGKRVCPYHGWSFELDGSPISSGRTDPHCKNNVTLKSHPVYAWNKMLFDSPINFDLLIDLNNMRLRESRVDIVRADYLNIMDLFLDVDHIQQVHSGVYDKIGLLDTTVDWRFGKGICAQLAAPAAYWIAIYPNTMIEWQRGHLFVTVAIPSENKIHSNVCVFKYSDEMQDNDSWKLNDSVWEEAWSQDKMQAELLTEFVNGNLEPQKQHFREFLGRSLHGAN